MKIKPIRHRPLTWAKIYDLTVYDIDGWRHDNKSFSAPIDEREWYNRMIVSTCIFGKTAFDKMKEAEKRLYEGN